MPRKQQLHAGATITGSKLAELLTGKNVCIRAGAGTGKTRLLVELFMALLRRRQAEVSEIAALTFTEKAAGELKERIRAACEREEQESASEEERCYWHGARRELESACIGTIHSFSARLLRENPFQAGIDPQFRVLDELSTQALKQEVVEETLSLLTDRESRELADLLRAFGRRGLARLMVRLLNERVKLETLWSSGTQGSGANPRLLKEIGARLARAQSLPEWKTALTVLQQYHSAQTDDKLEQKRSQVLAKLEELASPKEVEKALPLLRDILELTKGRNVGQKANWPEDARSQVRAALASLRGCLEQIAPLEHLFTDPDIDEKASQLSVLLEHVYEEVAQSYQARKDEAGMLDYDDMLLGALRLLSHHRGIRETYQRRLKHILVDEFQDNSHIDQELIALLTGEGPQARSRPGLTYAPGRLCVVGDDKQSIFRFRGAELAVFNELAEALEKEGEVLDMARNFRSLTPIIAFANQLFGEVMGRGRKLELFQNRYIDLEADRTQAPAREVVELLLVSAPGGGRLSTTDAHLGQADLIARRIEMLLANGARVVYDRNTGAARPVRCADIAILLRATTHISAYKRALSQRGIPYSVIADRGFYEVQEIMDCVNFLKFLDNEADEIALVGVLRSPFFAASDNALYHLSEAATFREGLEHFEEYVSDPSDGKKLARARKVTGELRHLRHRLPLPEVIDALVAKTGYDVVLLSQFMGRQKWANVQKLRQQAASLAPEGEWSLRRFVQYVGPLVKGGARGGEAPSEEEESDVVKLITIHKAKGLEFPVVFLPGLSDGSRGDRPGKLLIDRNLGLALAVEDEEGKSRGSSVHGYISWLNNRKREAEEQRLFYVACTRARDLLVLTGAWEDRPKRNTWMSWLREAFDINPDPEEDSFFRFGPQNSPFQARVRTGLPEVPTTERTRAQAPPTEAAKTLSPEQVQEILRRVAPIELRLAGKKHFTVSELAEYRLCPRLYQLKYLLGIPESFLASSEISFEGSDAREGDTLGIREPARLRGIVAHDVLNNLDWALPSQELSTRTMPEALGRALDTCGILPPQVRQELLEELEALLTRFLASPMAEMLSAAKERLAELPFSLSTDGAIIEGRIDLLFKGDDDNWRLLDYKTDRVTGEQAASRAQAYWPQLLIYAVACARMRKAPEEALLCFLTPNIVSRLKLDEDKLKAAREDIRLLIDGIREGRFTHQEGACAGCTYASVCKSVAD